jgi:hypothetical protein
MVEIFVYTLCETTLHGYNLEVSRFNYCSFLLIGNIDSRPKSLIVLSLI